MQKVTQVELPRVEPFSPGDVLEVIATKYDGRVTFRWDARLVGWRGDLCILSMPKGTRIHSTKRGTYELATSAFFYLDRHKWFNIAVHADDENRMVFCYCNVAMPPQLGSAISYVDLELDIHVHPDLSFDVLDRDEFVRAVEAMHIPRSIQQRAESALEELKATISARGFPFGAPFGTEPPLR